MLISWGSGPHAAPSELGEDGEQRFARGWVLGRGGMGVVVQAEDRQAGREVAIKHLSDEAADEHGRLLVAEARIQGRLDHPSIPPVYELGLDAQGHPYFAMRKIEGETLAELLARLAQDASPTRHKFSRERLLRIFVELCRAIEHAHQRGVVHLDLKPHNLMITSAGHVYVLDWGIASVGDAPIGGDVDRPRGGTLGYMAPESLVRETVPDARADVYSLGCILFEILAFEPLYPRTEGLLAAVLEGADGRPSQRAHGHGTPPALDEACVRATARDPSQRFATVAALATAVTDWLDGARYQALHEELSGRHLAMARALVEVGTPRSRGEALGEASRALALAPDDVAAAQLVRSLLEGDDLPAPAAAELAALEEIEERKLAQTASLAQLGFLLLPLTLLVQGGIAPWFVGAVVALTGAVVGLAALAARGRGPRAWLWWNLAGLAGLAILFSRYLGPFVLTPSIAALTAAGAMMHPRIRHRRLVIAVLCATTLLPFTLELAGVLAPTMGFEDGRWWLGSSVSMVQQPTLLGLALTSLAFVIVAILLGRLVAAPAHQARRTLAAQAWHLDRVLRPTAVDARDRRPHHDQPGIR